METLPDALKAFGAYPQFILYKLVPASNGKMDKLPVDHRTLDVFAKGSNWQTDPAAKTTFDAAAFLAAQLGASHGVGFFISESDPFFFVDIDNCLRGAEWSTDAMNILRALPGAAIEVSQSGKGLHVFGQYAGSAPDHACKNTPLGIEMYTKGRFVALTGKRTVGSAALDCTANLAALVNAYFPPSAGAGAVLAWTTEPVPEYTGAWTDEELVRKAGSARSARSAFDDSVSFAALWNAEESALAVAYPPQNNNDPFDRSSADAALAQHLAFWTGNNCERIQALMFESGLRRDKWDRKDYLHRTITRAVGRQTTVYSAAKVPDASDAPKLSGSGPQADYAASIRAQKLAEYDGDEEGRQLLLKRTKSKFWLDNKHKTAAEMVASITPVTVVTRPFLLKPEFVAGYQFLGPEQQAEFFEGCVYTQKEHRVFVPSGALLKPEQFNATYGGYVFAVDDSGDKTTRKAFEALTESQAVRYPKADTVCFRPDLKPGALVEQDGQLCVNTYVPVTTPRKVGDASPFLTHLAKLLPEPRDRQILLAYMAACVQHKGVKFQWAPLIQGVEGNGKTFLTRCVSAAIGERYVHLPPASEISEKFNAWLFNTLFVGVEDVYVSDNKREVIEILKPMITSTRLAKRAMQQNQSMHDVCCNFIFNSNHKDGVKKTRNDRRFAVFFCAQQEAKDLCRDGMTGSYFPDLYAWLRADGYAIVTEYLNTYPIPDELNPATACHRAPETSSTQHAILESMGGIEQEILEAIDEGRPGFAGGWVSSMSLDLMLRNKRRDMSIPINKRRALLKTLGYDWHPALSNGRVNNPVMPDNGKPRLFIREGHPHINLTTPKDVAAVYEAAQTAGGGPIGKVAEAFGGGV
jgi:primase-polymerase (primpol)-like protein